MDQKDDRKRAEYARCYANFLVNLENQGLPYAENIKQSQSLTGEGISSSEARKVSTGDGSNLWTSQMIEKKADKPGPSAQVQGTSHRRQLGKAATRRDPTAAETTSEHTWRQETLKQHNYSSQGLKIGNSPRTLRHGAAESSKAVVSPYKGRAGKEKAVQSTPKKINPARSSPVALNTPRISGRQIVQPQTPSHAHDAETQQDGK